MVFGGIVSSPRGSLSPQKALELANVYLETAFNANDPRYCYIALGVAAISLSATVAGFRILRFLLMGNKLHPPAMTRQSVNGMWNQKTVATS